MRDSTLSVGSTLDVKGAADCASTLGVAGAVTFDSTLSVGSTLDVKGAADCASTLGVAGAVTFDSTLSVGSTLDVKGAVDCASTLGVAGAVTCDSTLSVGSTLDVSGAANCASTLDVTGVVNLSDTLDVTGAVTCHSTLSVAGKMYAEEYNSSSDIRLKNNVKTIENPLCIVTDKRFRGVSWLWKDSKKGGHIRRGCIAQEIDSLLPGIVHKPKDGGYYSVNYDSITGVLMGAVKELAFKVKAIEAKLNMV